jgi:hypothetical protein
MISDQPVQPASPLRTVAGPAAPSAPICPPAVTDHGGWTVLRLEVINDAAGVCARCGMDGADTVVRGWFDEQLVAAHTRCVVGLGPDRPEDGRAA